MRPVGYGEELVKNIPLSLSGATVATVMAFMHHRISTLECVFAVYTRTHYRKLSAIERRVVRVLQASSGGMGDGTPRGDAGQHWLGLGHMGRDDHMNDKNPNAEAEDESHRHVNSIFEPWCKTERDYDLINNKGEGQIFVAQHAYYAWTQQMNELQLTEDRIRAAISENWTAVYQILGFYSVFQGVIFQAVATMSSVLSCGFYRIPVTLSVLATAATVLGIYWQLSKVLQGRDKLHQGAKIFWEVGEKLNACQIIDVKDFSFDKVEEYAYSNAMKMALKIEVEMYRKDSKKANHMKWIVLVFLATYSTMFSYLDYIVMCRGYR